MFIPTSIVGQVKKLNKKARITDGGKILNYNNQDFKILSVNPKGVVIEEYIDSCSGLTQVETIVPFEVIG